ncbi:MAG: GTP cyclohydrolase I FolE [Thermoanaerobaculaceae bacterium]|nr:GTP cyclohydrolase I FolE [Thermoanaerobaculaceae bacterium]
MHDIEAAAELLSGVGVATPEIEKAVKELLQDFGEDVNREGLEQTPRRVARMYDELLAGYRVDPYAVINEALFDVEYDQMVIVKDIEFYSLCEHHMLPFLGRAHVAYMPAGKVIGLSKIPRLVEIFARRLQVQERMTVSIAETLEELLEPRGVAVVAEATHLCMMMRGVRQQNASAITSSIRGEFERDPKTRAEFMELIRRQKPSFA